MTNIVFSLEEFNFDGKENRFYGDEGWGQTENFNSVEQQQHQPYYPIEEHQQKSFSDFGMLEDITFGLASQPSYDEITTQIQNNNHEKPKKENQFPFSLTSLELLNNYGTRFKRLNPERRIEAKNDTTNRKLSTEEVFRFAGEMFIQSSSQIVDGISMNNNNNLYFSGLSEEEIKDVELAEFLLASAEKIVYQQYERAARFLNQCDYLCSKTGNPVQRVVYCFSEALGEKIGRETGRVSSKDFSKRESFDIDQAMMSPNPATLACHEGVPFSKISQFTGIQAIVEKMVDANRIHVIDLAIRNGIQWTILMQALASRQEHPLELLKITAVGTCSKHLIEDTCKRLLSFAKSLNLPFRFNIVMVSDMLELEEDLFEVDSDEKVAVFSEFFLRTMLVIPSKLEKIMRVIRNINPCIMVITETEANHNSPVFGSRFVEALFFFSAFFDCLEGCMERNDPNRVVIESDYFGEGIRNIVCGEGNERIIRSVKIDVWRAFFGRFGIVEEELSMSSMYQANLLVKKFGCGNSCSLDMNGKSLIVGWKGTPIQSVSVWKFL